MSDLLDKARWDRKMEEGISFVEIAFGELDFRRKILPAIILLLVISFLGISGYLYMKHFHKPSANNSEQQFKINSPNGR